MNSQPFRFPARLAQRASAFDFGRRSDASRTDASLGFHESSFDLRTGLEVSEAPVTALPEDLVREFRRQRAA